MNGGLRRLAACALWLSACAGSTVAATLDGLNIQAAADTTRVVLDVSARVPFNVFTLENPHRVVIDLDATRPRFDVASTRVAGSNVTAIRGGPRGGGGYRVVLDVAQRLQAKGYMITSAAAAGDQLVVELRGGAGASRSASGSSSGTTPSAIAPPAATARTQGRNASSLRRDFIVAIDPGHGGQDPGAIGVGKVQEKHVALAIAKELQRLFNNTPGYRGELTRKGDYYLTLRQRTTVARNQRADLFVSIHADAFSRPDAHGASVYTLSAKGATSETARWIAEKENASDLIGGAGDVSLDDKDALLAHVLLDLSMDGNRSASIEAGAAVLAALDDFARLHRSHVEQAGFVVLKSPDIPSLLVETGYLSNPGEAKKLAQAAYQRRIAQAIFKGITTYAHRHAPPGTALASRQQKPAA